MRLHYIFSLLFLLCPGMGGTGPSVCDHMLNQARNLQLLSSSTQMSESVQFSCSVVSHSLWPHRLQHARLPYPSPIPGAYSESCPLSQWCHPTISSSIVPISSWLQPFPSLGSFPRLFPSGGQSIGVSASASVLPMNIEGWFPLRLTGLISLQSKGLSRVSPTQFKSISS